MAYKEKNKKERWRRIDDTRYFVSNRGRVKSAETFGRDKRGRVKHRNGVMLSLKGTITGYPVVNIIYKGKRKAKKVHQLVAEYFIDNPMNYKVINHVDGDKTNNNVENLEWCDQSHNIKHAYKIGLITPVRNFGLKNGFSKMVIDLSTGIVFYSITEAAETFGINRRTLEAMLTGQNPNKTELMSI